MVSEWITKEEMCKELKIPLVDLEVELPKLIDNKFIEEDKGKFRINNKDGKANDRIKEFLDNLNRNRVNPKVRHGYLHLKYKLSEKKEYPKEVIEMCKPDYDLENIHSEKLLEGAELFEIDEKTKWILKLTNNQIFKRNMPYEKVVLDCNLEIDNKWFKGFLITKHLVWSYWGDNSAFCDTPLIFDWEKESKIEKTFTEKLSKSTVEKLKVFICNFFDFLNNPEVRVVRMERSSKNRERRIREGKEPIPSANKIRISGTLRDYYDKLEITERTLNYRFWVRGHFMRFWNKKKFNNLYEKLKVGNLPNEYYVDDRIKKDDKIIMIWKKPYIKGEGVLISKRYKLEKTKR